MARRSVLLASAWYPPHAGGVERYSAAVARTLAGRGWRVDVVHSETGGRPRPGSGPAGERLLPLPSRVAAGRLPIPLPVPLTRQSLRDVAGRRYEFALVQGHLYLGNILAARAVADGVPVLWLSHGSGHVPSGNALVDTALHRYEHTLAALLRRRATVAAGVSQEAARWLAHFHETTTHSVGNGVDLPDPEDFVRCAHDKLRVVYVGRLEPGKGAGAAIRAVAQARAELGTTGPEVTLTVIGGGSQAERIRGTADPGVRLLGEVPPERVRIELADADVLIFPSRYPEGFPTVLLEAGAAGCAVVTTQVAGVRELIPDERFGWVVDHPHEISRVLAELARNRQAAASRGQALRSRIAAEYTWPAVTERILRLVGAA